MRKKKKYLYQLVISIYLLIIIPLSISFSIIFEKSYEEIRQNNNEYYQDVTQLFCESVISEISEFNQHATAFGVASRRGASNAGIFYEGAEKMTTNAYYWWEAARDLVEYGKEVRWDLIGVYYYDFDVVLYGGLKYSAERFIGDHLGAKADAAGIGDFFSQDKYGPFTTVFAPVFQKDGSFQSTLVGTCVRLGKNNERALLFYQMKSGPNHAFVYPHMEERRDGYYVIDSKSGEFLFGVGNIENWDVAIEENCNTDEIKLGERQELFSVHSPGYGLTFVVDTSCNVEQDAVAQFYEETQKFICCVLLVMIALGIVTVYLNYRPIYRMLKKGKEDSYTEFEIIESKIQRQRAELDEQRLLIVDLLMNRLLYGLPIPERHINKLVVDRPIKKYCVIFVDQYVLDSEESDHVMSVVDEQFNAMLFFADIQGEKDTVIIAFMETDNSNEIEAWICGWSAKNIKHSHSVVMGCVVNSLNDINKSLDDCRQQINAKNYKSLSDRQRADNYEILKDGVMQFLEEHYSNRALSQTMVADHFHLSIYSLSRMFKKQFGMSFSEYVNGKRLEKSRELLLSTVLSVKEIADEVGFTDANYFTRLFRQNFGISPTDFRKNR